MGCVVTLGVVCFCSFVIWGCVVVGRRYVTVAVSYEVWAELLRRKALLAQRRGRRVSFDDVIRELLSGANEGEEESEDQS